LGMGWEVDTFVAIFGVVPYRLGIPVSAVAKFLPYLTSMFLHAGFWHLAGNCLYLWVFGDNVEDKLGHGRFLLFYLLCGIAASALHTLFNLHSPIPAIGASGAIAGVLGAYFVLFPRAKVLTLLPILIFWQIIEIPAFFFLGFWFLYQFLLGVFSFGGGSGIAFWAHIGGFIAGIILLRVFLKMRNNYYSV
jgi:rhomboid family protein